MAKKDEKAKAVTQMQVKPNPFDDGIRPNTIERPQVANPSIIGGGGDVDECGNSPRFPKDPRFKIKEKINPKIKEVNAAKLKK